MSRCSFPQNNIRPDGYHKGDILQRTVMACQPLLNDSSFLSGHDIHSRIFPENEEDIETKATQLMWDIMFTTDPEFLSDGYRVQFQRVIDHETGEENIVDVIVEHANLGSG